MTMQDSADAAIVERDDEAQAQARIVDAGMLLAKDKPALREFFAALTANVSPDDVTRLTPQSLAILVRQVFERIETRKPGETMVSAFDPQSLDPSYSRHDTVLVAANDDSPFLFDSILGEANAQGARIRAVFHPVIKSGARGPACHRKRDRSGARPAGRRTGAPRSKTKRARCSRRCAWPCATGRRCWRI